MATLVTASDVTFIQGEIATKAGTRGATATVISRQLGANVLCRMADNVVSYDVDAIDGDGALRDAATIANLLKPLCIKSKP